MHHQDGIRSILTFRTQRRGVFSKSRKSVRSSVLGRRAPRRGPPRCRQRRSARVRAGGVLVHGRLARAADRCGLCEHHEVAQRLGSSGALWYASGPSIAPARPTISSSARRSDRGRRRHEPGRRTRPRRPGRVAASASHRARRSGAAVADVGRCSPGPRRRAQRRRISRATGGRPDAGIVEHARILAAR
jgi:hypothetical protein